MASNKTWTMNCILLGAEVARLLEEGKEAEAKEKIGQLTSEFELQDVDYLIFRLKERR